MMSYSKTVTRAIVARKRMSGHVSLNTAAKRAINSSFFYCEKCLAQDFKSLAQDHILFVSYVSVTVKILCVFVVSHRKFRILENPENIVFSGSVSLLQYSFELSLAELRSATSRFEAVLLPLFHPRITR